MPLAATLRHITVETGDEQVTPQGYVTDATIRSLTPLLERALGGEDQVPLAPTEFWFRAREAGDLLRAAIGHSSAGDAVLIEMTVRPPEEQDGPAILQESVGGAFEAIASGALDPARQREVARVGGELERYIVWAWLELRGFASRADDDQVSPVEALMSIASGGMIYTITEDEAEQPLVAFLIRDEPHQLATIPPDPEMLLQITIFRVDGILLVPLVAHLGDSWYETWINAWADDYQDLEVLVINDN